MTVELGALIAALVVIAYNLWVGAALPHTSPTRVVRVM
jgi:hypothetical protein